MNQCSLPGTLLAAGPRLIESGLRLHGERPSSQSFNLAGSGWFRVAIRPALDTKNPALAECGV